MIRDIVPRSIMQAAPGWRLRWWGEGFETEPPTADEIHAVTMRGWEGQLDGRHTFTVAELRSDHGAGDLYGLGSIREWKQSQDTARAAGFSSWTSYRSTLLGGEDPDLWDLWGDE